jgi:hypothetical protein
VSKLLPLYASGYVVDQWVIPAIRTSPFFGVLLLCHFPPSHLPTIVRSGQVLRRGQMAMTSGNCLRMLPYYCNILFIRLFLWPGVQPLKQLHCHHRDLGSSGTNHATGSKVQSGCLGDPVILLCPGVAHHPLDLDAWNRRQAIRARSK